MNKYIVSVFNTCTNKYELVEVSQEVYQTFTRTQWNIDDNDSSFYAHQIPVSFLEGTEEDLEAWERFDEFVARCVIAIREEAECYARDQEHKALINALKSLKATELELIKAIYFNGMTDKAYADSVGRERTSVNKSKKRILSKIKKEILNNLE